MTSVLITGSSRGIGLELTRRFLEHNNPPKLVIATCRNPNEATILQNLAKTHPNLQIMQLDVDDIDSYPELVEKVSSLVGDAGLNVLVNNAAIYVRKSPEEITWRDYQSVLHTNTIAPRFLAKALLPLLKKAASVNSKKPKGISKAAILNITSDLGSITLNNGGFPAYRESKSALNQSGRTLAAEVGKDGILVVNIHPGWVRTDMGGSEADISVEESTQGLINLIYNLKESDHSSYLNYKGETLPW